MTGPDPALRARTTCEVWGEVRDAAGGIATASLVGPNAYDLTADSVVRATRLLLDGVAAPGAHTPSSAFGADYVGTLDGVRVTA
jgi:saccharopine dehydrogenase (NAD+, L-lysine-forming)